jgi:hypothetical protein
MLFASIPDPLLLCNGWTPTRNEMKSESIIEHQKIQHNNQELTTFYPKCQLAATD